MYVLASNDTVEAFPYSIDNLKRDNRNTSFPKNLSDELLADWNVFPVVDRPAPAYDVATQNCIQINPTLNSGEWLMTWQVSDATREQISSRLAEESEIVRQQRNQLLSDCDWTQLADQPLSDSDQSAWRSYRQNLRDVSKQSGFPWNITWPEAPSS